MTVEVRRAYSCAAHLARLQPVRPWGSRLCPGVFFCLSTGKLARHVRKWDHPSLKRQYSRTYTRR